MSKPSNPYEIVIKNRFFPDGVTEQDLYQYWIKKKFEILRNLEGSRSIFYINGDLDKLIVRRYLKANEQIKLIPENYDNVVTGRTVGILRVFDERSDFGIVDVDSRRALNEISPAADFEDVGGVHGVHAGNDFDLAAEAVHGFLGHVTDGGAVLESGIDPIHTRSLGQGDFLKGCSVRQGGLAGVLCLDEGLLRDGVFGQGIGAAQGKTRDQGDDEQHRPARKLFLHLVLSSYLCFPSGKHSFFIYTPVLPGKGPTRAGGTNRFQVGGRKEEAGGEK